MHLIRVGYGPIAPSIGGTRQDVRMEGAIYSPVDGSAVGLCPKPLCMYRASSCQGQFPFDNSHISARRKSVLSCPAWHSRRASVRTRLSSTEVVLSPGIMRVPEHNKELGILRGRVNADRR